jgi:proteasome lid subunit RPN8/RPN11
MLKLHRQVAKAICDHAARELPYEACGYLAGKEEPFIRYGEHFAPPAKVNAENGEHNDHDNQGRCQ